MKPWIAEVFTPRGYTYVGVNAVDVDAARDAARKVAGVMRVLDVFADRSGKVE